MKEKDFTYLAEEFKRGIDNEISYIYSCFVPADAKNVLAVMKGNIAVADREFLSADTRVSVGNRWTCPYDLLLDRVESKVEDFYAEIDLSIKTLEKLSRYGERAELFKKEFRENLAKSEQTTRNQLIRELELMVMQGKDVKAVLKHMNTAIEKRTNALNSLLSSTAGQMERYMVLWDYQDNGYTKYRFITVGDNCEHCTELNGKVFDITDVTNFPPLHPNCNCRADILDKDGNSVATLQDIDADDKLDYLKTSLKQMLLGNYTEDTNLLGTLGQVALGFLGLDLPADIRDLLYDITHWKLTPSHAMQTILDAAALLPVVGSIKYSDEAADAVKGVIKYGDDVNVLKVENSLKTIDTENLVVLETKEPGIVNDEWLMRGYDKPPYDTNYEVRVVLAGDEEFVRFFSYNVDGTSNKLGTWLMRKKDVIGLTAQQIADKFSLPKIPTHVCDVKLNGDTKLQTGIANPVEIWGKGGGQQFETLGVRLPKSAYINERLIGEIGWK